MKALLETIRKPQKNQSLLTTIFQTLGIILCGFLLGVLQKWMDGSANNVLPNILNQLDIRNYFGRFAIWILIATMISVYAKTPLSASIHTFFFFISMLSGYYLYCNYVLGFLPKTYMMMWFIIALITVFPAYICWYAKGKGIISILISGVILGVLFSQAVHFTQGIYITYFLEVITWLVGVIVLYRKPKELTLEIGLSCVVAFLYQFMHLYWG